MDQQPLRSLSPCALSARVLALSLALLFCLPAYAPASSDPVPLRRHAGSAVVDKSSGAFRYHTAECRYVLNDETQPRFATAKLTAPIYAESRLVACMEPGYLQWT